MRLASRKEGCLVALSPRYCVLRSGRAFRRGEWHLSSEQLSLFNLKFCGARDERCVEHETWRVDMMQSMQERSNKIICNKTVNPKAALGLIGDL